MRVRRYLGVSSGWLIFVLGCGCAGATAKPPAAATGSPSVTTFVSSWKSPTAQPLHVKGAKVAAVVILSDVAARRSAEDFLAREISARGGVGVPMYSLVDPSPTASEPVARDALQKAEVQGVVVLHPAPAETAPGLWEHPV
jgi:hypothetical protein